MPLIKNIILNGTFDQCGANWIGNDIEIGLQGVYLKDGSLNPVSELDGNAGQTTLLAQAFNIAGRLETRLTFDAALRTESNPNAGLEGFRVYIVDANQTPIAMQDFYPTGNSLTPMSMDVTFPEAGQYAVAFVELGPDDSLGAIVDNISILVCFTAGTAIDTPTGPRAVEALAPGDLVCTEDNGPMPLRWIGQRRVGRAELRANPRLRPVVFEPGALGAGLPRRRLAVSPQHRILRAGQQCELLFGAQEILIPAHRFVNALSVHLAEPEQPVTYVHFLFDGHQIVRAEGVETESFFPSALSLQGLSPEARQELLTLFPDLPLCAAPFAQTARMVVQGPETRLVAGDRRESLRA